MCQIGDAKSAGAKDSVDYVIVELVSLRQGIAVLVGHWGLSSRLRLHNGLIRRQARSVKPAFSR